MQYNMYKDGNDVCSKWAQHVYGAPWQGRHILHLDGREGSAGGLRASSTRSSTVAVGNVTVSSGVSVGDGVGDGEGDGDGDGVKVGVNDATQRTLTGR